ncbi:hypothetical protein BASA81_011284 [Batrachochytrium salamandrivorans]|nr:hypothetical protein BASA81_011284 [Batrachochytrium salamandrivorans]
MRTGADIASVGYREHGFEEEHGRGRVKAKLPVYVEAHSKHLSVVLEHEEVASFPSQSLGRGKVGKVGKADEEEHEQRKGKHLLGRSMVQGLVSVRGLIDYVVL